MSQKSVSGEIHGLRATARTRCCRTGASSAPSNGGAANRGTSRRSDLPYARRCVPIWSAVIWHASGHGKSELRAAAWRLRDRDGAAVGLDQALDDEQAATGPAPALRAPELTQHPRRELRTAPRTLVADGNRNSGSAMDHCRLDHGSNRTI